MTDDLDRRLIDAHEHGDGIALALLYREAADSAEDAPREAFFLTQAWVFALESGLPMAAELKRRLVAMGRDH